MKITEKERKELVILYNNARNTPVIKMVNTCLSENAWYNVRRKLDELGRKYKFNPEEIAGINPKTGEIVVKSVGAK